MLMVNIVVTLYLLLLSYYNRLSNDDWTFWNALSEKGIWGFIGETYLTWQGRFSGFFLTSLDLLVYQCLGDLILPTLVLILAGTYANYLLLKFYFPNINKKLLIVISNFLFYISILGLLDFTTFYWVCASGYIKFVVLSEFLFYFVIKKSSNIVDYILIILLSLLIGGSAETFTPIILLLIFVRVCYCYFKSYAIFIECKKELLALCVVFIGFLFMVFAPGNAVRLSSFEHDFSFSGLLLCLTKAFAQYFIYQLPKIFYATLALFPGIFVGQTLGESSTLGFMKNISVKKVISISSLILFIVIVLAVLPGSIAVYALLPLRSLSFLSFVLVAHFFFIGIFLGINNYKLTYYVPLCFIVFFLILGYRFYKEIPNCQPYVNSLSKREFKLQILNEQILYRGVSDTLVYIQPLPDFKYKDLNCIYLDYMESLIYPNREKKINFKYFPFLYDELSSDKNNFRNISYKKRLNLKFDIAIVSK